VLEIGVWMLEGLHAVHRSPHLAIFTNLLPDHLDAFDSMDDYGEAKCSIFRYQRPDDLALFNADNAYTRRYATTAPGTTWLFSPKQRKAYLRDASAERRAFAYARDIRLRGAHNLGNVQAATLAAELIGIPSETIHAAVASYQPMPARLELVRVLDGVSYVNDSASTAPVAGVAALRSYREPIVLIAGGNSKRLDASEFAAEAAARAKAIVLLKGTASEEFAEAVRVAAARRRAPLPIRGPFDDFAQAVAAAREAAAPGDVVLLSPGFTSFGMFLNEFDRGDQYCALVRDLPERP
jgi:UDP-N-acetylmuramoylalanine--D-glutamate ligase